VKDRVGNELHVGDRIVTDAGSGRLGNAVHVLMEAILTCS